MTINIDIIKFIDKKKNQKHVAVPGSYTGVRSSIEETEATHALPTQRTQYAIVGV